jgi:hypothetical protein
MRGQRRWCLGFRVVERNGGGTAHPSVTRRLPADPSNRRLAHNDQGSSERCDRIDVTVSPGLEYSELVRVLHLQSGSRGKEGHFRIADP